ncbi:C40 family peptidase [Polaribacter aquimarinus]|uniref:NlpC/P60 family protein n=1 Tax=Polaribacter aquimarinus TaxID=2100726 RepID=A0A2U2JE54_9FLAO|nr:C40 family peptidase [Polaribacter aquimarinus]PWG06617.1 NlpC/P60 family protein [Polaribacter aquimarinus]
MKKIMFLMMVLTLVLSSCSSSKNVSKNNKKPVTKADKIIANAMQYKGVRYKFGGTTKRGMDCSGVVYVAYGSQNIQLPRISRDMAKKGRKISLNKVKKGDLVFFRTSKRRRRINHVGLVVSNKKGQIRFIHATSSRGVIISLISEKYWKNAFVKATTVL